MRGADRIHLSLPDNLKRERQQSPPVQPSNSLQLGMGWLGSAPEERDSLRGEPLTASREAKPVGGRRADGDPVGAHT
jgi:hypothetical protein